MSSLLNVMSVDVEEHFQVSGFEHAVPRDEWDAYPSRVVDNTRRLLDLFDEAGVEATFFVLGWVAERQPALVAEIASRGHEVACHGYSHRLVYEQGRDEFHDEVTRSLEVLRQVSGQEVNGYRAASFSIVSENLWALDVLAQNGVTYDSSLFPVRHDRYGLPGAPRNIHRLITGTGNRLLEVPPSTLRVGGMVLPVAGGGYLRLYPERLTSWAIRRINAGERSPAIVYVHPWEVDPDQPRISAGWKSSFRHYVGLGTTARKLSRLMRRFRFGSMRQVLRGLDGVEEHRL